MMCGTVRDAVYGAAVGDALGVPYEFKARGTFDCHGMTGHGTHNQPAGTYSDDTAMILATCDSIRERVGIDVGDMRGRFCDWLDGGRYAIDGIVFDVGGATARALRQGRGCSGEFDNGNGSLMRIAPLAFTDASDDEVRAVSAITHAHSTSTEACVEFVGVARALAGGASVAEVCRGRAGTRRAEVRSSGYVLDTLDASMWCLANTGSYRECVLEAVNLGDDTDTTACVAGALAGIVYGYGSIPAEWMNALRGKDIIESCLF